MVARTWRGWTRREDAEAYVAYLEQTGMPAYRSTPGNHGAWILRHDDGERTEFVTLRTGVRHPCGSQFTNAQESTT
jgi:hypothetical protein